MRKLLAAAVITLGLLALLGAGKGGTYQGGSYGSAGATYQAGGAPAGWDTVVVIFTTQARAAIANPSYAGVDTFALPSSPSANDLARIYELNDYVLGRHRKSWRADNADTAHVYHLGTATSAAGFKGDIGAAFAYTEIDSNRGNAGPQAKDATGTAVAMVADRRIVAGGINALQLRANWETAADTARNIGAPHYELVYVPLQNVIPSGATIVSAAINVAPNGSMYMDTSDSLVCTLMTNPNDSQWYLVKGYDANHTSLAKATWRRQRDASWGGTTNASPWSPELNARGHMWDWGTTSDWTGSVVSGGTPIGQGASTPINATNCVQAIANGAVNNGFLLSFHSGGAAAEKFTHFSWDRVSHANVNNRTPYIVVKYITKRYQKPFGTSEWAFMFASDDGKYPANAVWADTIEARGGKFTLFMAENQVSGGTGACTPAQLLSFYTRGHEIGSHSRFHVNPRGLTRYEMKDAPFDAGDWDSLLIDSSPDWMYALADGIVGDLRSAPYFGKSIALPNNKWSPTVIKAIQYHGYEAMRSGVLITYDRVKHYEPATFAPARVDTLLLGANNQAGRYKRNMIGLPYTDLMTRVVGLKANTNTTVSELDSVRINMRRLVYTAVGQGRGAVLLFAHDLKTAPSSGGYAEGIDANEVGALAGVVNAWGGRWMTASEYARWIKAGASAVASPTRAAVPDSFSYTSGQRVWFKPDGVDNRWIRGVK